MKNLGLPLTVSCGIALIAIPSFASELIFDSDFDSQANWAPEFANQRYLYDGSTYNTGPNRNIPGNFDFYYTSEKWHPVSSEKTDSGDPLKEPVGQISAKVSRNTGGKSFIVYDESYGGPSQWGSDAVLTKDLGREYSELWIDAWVRFDSAWVWADQIQGKGQSTMKFLRCRRHSGITTDNRFSYYGADARSGSPVAILDLKSWTTSAGNYARPLVALRGYTHPDTHETENDYFVFSDNYPTKVESSIKSNEGDSLSWQEVFLDDQWHKVNLYLKMDSSPGSKDGKVGVWVDGNEVIFRDDVPWRQSTDPSSMGWNECSVGGNANNIPYPEADQHEQWYAVDDLKIYNGRPNSPRPPTDVKISIE